QGGVERVVLVRPVHGQGQHVALQVGKQFGGHVEFLEVRVAGNADGYQSTGPPRIRSMRRQAWSSSRTRRAMTSAAGGMSSISPTDWPTSTLPQATSPSRAACLRLLSWKARR